MIQLKSNDEINTMRRANAVVAEVLIRLSEVAAPGMTTDDLDKIASDILDQRGAGSPFLGYHGYPKVLCTSVNDRVVHGIPRSDEVLKEGDIVSCDFGAIIDGYVGDSARTLAIGKVSDEALRLMDVTKKSLEAGLAACVAGNRLRDVSGAVEDVAAPAGYGIVRDYVGHGIGREMHERPQVPNYRSADREQALRLKPGLVIAIEPMINAGTHETRVLEDGWTVVTADGKLSAHFEHSVAITEKGPWILSDPDAVDPR